MTETRPRPDTNATTGSSFLVGAILVLIGVLWLLGTAFDINLWSISWPFFVIVPGVAILFGSLARPGAAGSGSAAFGAMLTITGLLLLYQSRTGHFASWAYAWALVAPFGAGAGQFLAAFRNDDAAGGREAVRAMATGLVLFVAGFGFFEGILDISSRSFGFVDDVALPALLIGAGAYTIFRRD